MYRKNTASQFLCFQGVDATTGGIKSGVTWTVRRSIDGTFAAGGGTVTEDSTNGWYKYAMTQADTNGNDISFNFTGSGAVPQTVNIITTACDPTVATNFGITGIPAVASGSAGALLIDGTGTAAISNSGGKVLLQATQSGVTIPTVSNLTNAPTAGDFTADMKTSLNAATPALSAAGLDNVVVEAGLNARQALSILSSALAGILSGAGTTTITIDGAGVATVRIVATVDTSGNRSAVVLTPPA